MHTNTYIHTEAHIHKHALAHALVHMYMCVYICKDTQVIIMNLKLRIKRLID